MRNGLIYSILLQAMYPAVVIVLVETQGSMTDVCELSSTQTFRESCAVTSNHLSFTVGTRQTQTIATDEEPPYERSCAFQVEDGQQHDWEKGIGTGDAVEPDSV